MGNLTHKRLLEVLHYNPDTGIFTWDKRPSRFIKKGSDAGSLSYGYIRIKVSGKSYFAHRLAWLYMTGQWPNKQIDHIDHDRANNSWRNLRAVTRIENARNRRINKNNSTGVCGVYQVKTGGWRSSIYKNGRLHHLYSGGSFDDALSVRKLAEAEIGFHKNHGQI